MGRIRQSVMVAFALVCIALAPGCMKGDPADEVLKARRLWKVDLISFVERQDGGVSAQFRISGPVYNTLTDLTVRLELLDETGTEIGILWPVFDLRDIRRGEAVEKIITIPAPAGGQVVDSILLDTMVSPEPDQLPKILELQGL